MATEDVIHSPGTPPDRAVSGAEPARAVTELFREHHLELVRLALLMVSDLATAEDVVQDAFEQLHRRWRSLRKQSSVPVHVNNAVSDWSITGAADGRTFIIAVDVGLSHLAGTANLRFFRLEISADGKPGKPGEVPVPWDGALNPGMALSPDRTMLALSIEYDVPGQVFGPYGSIEVVNLVSGATRTWTGHSAPGYYPGTPLWENDDRTVMFTWWHYTSLTTSAAVIAGVRELDTAAPGNNLLASRLTGFHTAIADITSAVITVGGRDIIASSCRDVTSVGGHSDTARAQVVELSAADGQLVRVLGTQTTRFRSGADEQDALDATCSVLSADATGQHVLVQAFSFGRIDNGVFTALPGASPRVLFVAAAW